MKWISQVLIISTITFLGELLNSIIPFPIPSSIYGMLILFILLCTKIIKLEQIKETSYFLIDIMPMLFIPSAVGIIAKFDAIKNSWWQIIIITVVSTITTMLVTGWVSQIIIHFKTKKKDKSGE